MSMPSGQERRIGVYVCHCGGNISDHVDVDKVISSVQSDPGVVVAKTAMFTCSDASQQEIIDDIKEQKLDGIVVASCSPKLHTFTFREAAKRADLNPYEYTQVNLREQCSWTHTDDPEGATDKAVRLVRAGIAHTRLTEPLEPIVVNTVPATLVVGGGVAGLRAALGLADIGLGVYLVEREEKLGGWVGRFGEMYPHGKNGKKLIDHLVQKVSEHPKIKVFTESDVVGKAGTFGNLEITVRTSGDPTEQTVKAGSVIVATGFDSYRVSGDEFGYGNEGVVTLPEFMEMVDAADGVLEYKGDPVRSVAYIYCVGSRQPEGNTYCSRYCCTAAIHASLSVGRLSGGEAIRQYHLYRDIRSYGSYELLYNESRAQGDLYLRFPDDEPPVVVVSEPGAEHRLAVTTRDVLTDKEELTIPVDLAVLVTGMVPRENDGLVQTLKLPVGRDGFFNEIHPKLRPVETVVDGVYICGACQSPKNSAEAVGSGLAAVAQSASILKRGFAELDPLIAVVYQDACAWCGECLAVCPYDAPVQVDGEVKSVAVIDKAACKGCGACIPACPKSAIDLQGYTDAQIRAMIDGLVQEIVPCDP